MIIFEDISRELGPTRLSRLFRHNWLLWSCVTAIPILGALGGVFIASSLFPASGAVVTLFAFVMIWDATTNDRRLRCILALLERTSSISIGDNHQLISEFQWQRAFGGAVTYNTEDLAVFQQEAPKVLRELAKIVDDNLSRQLAVAAVGTTIWAFGDLSMSLLECGALSC